MGIGSKSQLKEMYRICSGLNLKAIRYRKRFCSEEPRFYKLPEPGIPFCRRHGWLDRVKQRNINLKYKLLLEDIYDCI